MTSQAILSSLSKPPPHFVLIPLMAQGHMIPMVDLAHLLAHQGALVTFVTTPLNACRIRTTIEHARDTGISIRFVELPFPCKEMDLPEGSENMDSLPSAELALNFFEGMKLLAKPLELYLRQQKPYPSCMIADFCHPWTQEVADNFQIPRLTFFSICCFTLLCDHNISHHKVYDRITNEHEPYEVPGLTQKILVTKDQAPGFFNFLGWEAFAEKVNKAELAAAGVVVNTFDDLEPSYVESYQKAKGKKVWTVGPFSLRNKDLSDKAVRGNKASIDANQCLSWLDAREPRSTIYVNFGSLIVVKAHQLMEIGFGLEASNNPFIWVIKESEISPEVEAWLSAFRERTRARGLIIKGWAPQVLILSHTSVGGFMTHCGWNSILESISEGVPMITWPHFADQFLNERMVVDVLKIGVSVGVKKQGMWTDNQELVATRKDVKKAVNSLMDGGEEAGEIRQRVMELAKKAKQTMKGGGSSYDYLTSLIKQFSVEGKNNG